MIDIHSHILPGLDDGSQSLEDSLAMLDVAARSGTTDIVATPHANPEFSFDPDVVSGKIDELVRAAGPSPRIHRGCDFHLSYDNIQDAVADPAKYTINNRHYLLVEFSDLLIFKNTGEIFDLLLANGMVPIVTHPERNYLLHQRLADLTAWAEKGCLFQVTAASFLGRFGTRAKRFSETLMERGLVHVVASDAHDPEDRTPDLSAAFEHVSSRYGPDWAEHLFRRAPRQIIDGAPLNPQDHPPIPKTRKWYQFW